MSQLPDQQTTSEVSEDPDEFIEQISESEIPKEPYESVEVKLKWSRVIIVAIVISFIVVGITLLIFWILGRQYDEVLVFFFLSWAFLIETGLLLIFGGCIGTVRQSFTIDRIKKRFTKGESITGADTKIAIGSAYTYILSGVLLSLASLI
ncbi:MAG: hypothetical protein KAJ76_10970, partial [Candidatus Heimdallarchaeota archaeon]|nr:hypothetical protein [Candidatus Heimdallarchaeota archaeon]